MRKQGKILRDTTSGAWLLLLDGPPFTIDLKKKWGSETPPTPGMMIHANIDEAGKLQSISPLNEERLKKRKRIAQKTRHINQKRTFDTDIPVLVATIILTFGWFFLVSLSFQLPDELSVNFTFWGLLNYIDAGGQDGTFWTHVSRKTPPLYRYIVVVVLLCPLLPTVWKSPKAYLAGLVPLFLMVLVSLLTMLFISYNIQGVVEQALDKAQTLAGGNTRKLMETMSLDAATQTIDALSIGIGAYVSGAASFFLAARSSIKFFSACAL